MRLVFVHSCPKTVVFKLGVNDVALANHRDRERVALELTNQQLLNLNLLCGPIFLTCTHNNVWIGQIHPKAKRKSKVGVHNHVESEKEILPKSSFGDSLNVFGDYSTIQEKLSELRIAWKE